jgi:hypothetical protein
MNPEWKTSRLYRMLPRALFHMKDGKPLLGKLLDGPGVYVLYRNDDPYFIGKTSTTIFKRLKQHALRPNARRYNFWNYFSAFAIDDDDHRDEVEAILIAAMPTAANGMRPKLDRMKVDRPAARLINRVQALMLTGKEDTSGEANPELTDKEDES